MYCSCPGTAVSAVLMGRASNNKCVLVTSTLRSIEFAYTLFNDVASVEDGTGNCFVVYY